MLLISPLVNWGITAISTTSSGPRSLKTFFKSRLKIRMASRRTCNRKLFFFVTPRLTGARLFLLFPGLDRLQQRGPSFSCSSTYCTSPSSTTSEIRTVVLGAVSPKADEATVSAHKPTLLCISQRLPSCYDFFSARFQFCNYGSSVYTNSSPRVRLSTIPNSICGSDSSVQHANPSLRESFFL